MSPTTRGVLTATALLLIPLIVLTGSDALRDAVDFTAGVLSLVALTSSVVWGLVASDRIFLSTRQRLLAQAVHRITAVASLGFLLLHGTVKLALQHVSVLGALVPFSLGVSGAGGLIGFGVLAGLLMLTTGVTGALRSAFASPARIAGRWRGLHTLAYPAWCAALLHGLYAGRPPSGPVVALYCLCLVAVGGALALRAAPPPVKRKVARHVLRLLAPPPRGRRAAHRRSPFRGAAPRDEATGQPVPGPMALARSQSTEPLSYVPTPGSYAAAPERPAYAPGVGLPAYPPPPQLPGPPSLSGLPALPEETIEFKVLDSLGTPGDPSGPDEHRGRGDHWFTPPAPPLYEATPHPPVDPPPGIDIRAAYRVLSTTETPPPGAPPADGPPPSDLPAPELPSYTPRAYDPFDTGETPSTRIVRPSQSPGSAPTYEPSAQDDTPFGAPSSGEPWGPSGSAGPTGDRR